MFSYYQSYKNYFWQWEDDNQFVAIPNGSTIAYRKQLVDIIEKLYTQGLPPLGSLLLVMIVLNPTNNLEFTIRKLNDFIDNDSDLLKVIPFLKRLATIDEIYKTGVKKTLLLRTLFNDCHNIIGIKKSKLIKKETNWILDKKYSRKQQVDDKIELTPKIISLDFRTLDLLGKKFPTIEVLIQKMANLPKVEEEIHLESQEIEPKNLIEELILNSKTFRIGALVKTIYAGINLPFHSTIPSQQPIGGVSDLTNKGNLDQLLISEYANEDIVFLSRLANNEALYLSRESPPASNDLKRVILIDVSLKNWGTPKTIAFAIMLAIAKHPKTDIAYQVFVIGNNFHEVHLDSINTLISGIQLIDASLDASKGLTAYFEAFPEDKNRELFVLTEKSTKESMHKVYNDYANKINYWIYNDVDGNVDIYKKLKNSKKHVQHIEIPIERLWQKKTTPKDNNEILNIEREYYPVLTKNEASSKKYCQTENGEKFQITKNKSILRLSDKLANNHQKGWELFYENLPITDHEVEMGVLKNGEYILLLFNRKAKGITLLNLNTKQEVKTKFREWTASGNFIYKKQKFYYWSNYRGTYEIDLEGNIKKVKDQLENDCTSKLKLEKELLAQFGRSTGTFKNIDEIAINENGNLMFNYKHELVLNSGNHIKIDRTRTDVTLVEADKYQDGFKFDDGSIVTLNKSGFIILKSSNENIPIIFIPSVIDVSLGVATYTKFAGNKFYYKEPLFTINLLDAGTKKLAIVKSIKEFTNLGLQQSKEIADDTPCNLKSFFTHKEVRNAEKRLQACGAKVEVKSVNKDSTSIKTIQTEVFFEQYIKEFINTIINYGT